MPTLRACLFVLSLYLLLISVNANCDVYGSILKKGETKAVAGKCSQIVCKGASYDDFEVKACPNAYAPKNCNFVPADLSKPYPQCCPHWKC
ncbi:PREDICTED: la1-like protein 13 [Bactrocera latifrons]|uniref:la1-like protein 13 n=1 Tax=Bactrocera latifrons TaxID=174628 RepID=UPI0008DCEED0|nr:PREDICTED: la1-like protein 13 [Bactrocera latifrons]